MLGSEMATGWGGTGHPRRVHPALGVIREGQQRVYHHRPLFVCKGSGRNLPS